MSDSSSNPRANPSSGPARRPPGQGRHAKRTDGIGRASLIMASGTLTSRVLGMIRGVLLAAVMGVGLTASTFNVANTLPNNIYQLIAGGILGAVLVPQIAKAASHDDGGDDFVNRLLTLAITLMAFATLVATLAAPLLVRLYADHKWGPTDFALSTTFALICLPQIFFYGLTALLGQVLNARGRFAAYMWAPVLANIIAIGGILAFMARGLPREAPTNAWTPEMIWLIAGTTTLGIAVQGLFLFIPLHLSGFRYRPTWGFRGVGLGSASKVAGWTFAALVVSQLGFIVTSRVLTHADKLAEVLGIQAAGNAAYSYAFLLFMLPHSMVTISLVTALFTRLSYAAHEGRTEQVLADFHRGLRSVAVFLIPMSLGGVLLAPLITRALFFGNGLEATNAIARIMAVMLLGLIPYGWVYLVQRMFYVYEDAKTPFWMALVITGVATVVNLVSYALPPAWVGVGVGLGQTVSNVLGAGVGIILLRRRLGPLHLGPTVQQHLRLVTATALGLVGAALVVLGLRAVLGESRTATLVTVVISGIVLLALTLIGAARLQVREVRDALRPIAARLPGGRTSPR
ncbi:MAG: murein biosynthesis integral membrane protein MurJ [Nostocoides sp.]